MPMPDKRTRIVLVWTNLARRGGIRTFVFDCLEHLPGMGVDVSVLEVAGAGRDAEVEAHGRNIVSVPRRAWDSENSFWRRVRSRLREIAPDLVVFIEWVHADDVLAVAPPSVPAVGLCFVDRSDEAYYLRARELRPRLRGLAANSRTIVERLRRTVGDAGLPVEYLPLGVRVPAQCRNEQGADPAEPFRLVFMQRLQSQQKRARDLVPFARQLRARREQVRLDIIGDGEDAGFLRQELADDLAHGWVHLHGALPLPAALEILGRAQVFLLFSAYEGMPLSLQSAMAAGVVPVATDIASGIREVLVDGANASLFPVGDAAAAAGLVLGLEQDRTRWKRMGEAARETGKQFDLLASMTAYRDLFVRHAGSVDWSKARRPGQGASLRTRLWLERPRVLSGLGRARRQRGDA